MRLAGLTLILKLGKIARCSPDVLTRIPRLLIPNRDTRTSVGSLGEPRPNALCCSALRALLTRRALWTSWTVLVLRAIALRTSFF